MQLGYVGLGKMGLNMVERMIEKGHEVIAFDRSAGARSTAGAKGAGIADSLGALAARLAPPRLVWIMVPHGAVEAVLTELAPPLAAGDTVVDGGNSPYRESVRRAKELAARGIGFLDAGVSGGPSGARNGACIMVGGASKAFRRFEGLFRDLAVDGGLGHMGAPGAGHFVKMVHNGIEYGMMQALAEGFAVMRASPFKLDLGQIADVYNHRSVIESRLVGWLKDAFARNGAGLESVSGTAAQSGEGQWTVDAAKELNVDVPVIEDALRFRIASVDRPSYTARIISALRHEFGGHAVQAPKEG